MSQEGPLSSDETQVGEFSALRHLGESLQGSEGGPVLTVHVFISGSARETTCLGPTLT